MFDFLETRLKAERPQNKQDGCSTGLEDSMTANSLDPNVDQDVTFCPLNIWGVLIIRKAQGFLINTKQRT